MLACGMVDLSASEPRVVNGVFCVPKEEGALRLIIDARPANAVFADPPPVSLPSPDVIARLRVPAGGAPFFAAKADLDNFYHRLRLPASLVPYFGLPPLPGTVLGLPSSAAVWPCCRTLPMGWAHSVFLAQRAHEHLLDSASRLVAADRITATSDTRLDRPRHGVYIDDLFLFGPDPAVLSALLQEYLALAARHGIPSKPSKVVWPTASPVACLGLDVDGSRGTLGLAPDRLEALARATLAVLERGTSDGPAMRELIGRWVWAALPFRPALSCLHSAFRFCQRAGRRTFSIWPSVRVELLTLVRLRPLLFADVADRWFSHAVATDASDVGLGVMAAPASPGALGSLASLSGRSPSTLSESDRAAHASAPAGLRWSVIAASRWQRPEHINALEARALATAVRWSLSKVRPAPALNSRLLVLCDSAVVVAAASKGRSSSALLLRRLRQLAALLLAAGARLHLVWVPSAANPADAPSRW
jgi:hypothetical protein